MHEKPPVSRKDWVDPDDAPELTGEEMDRADARWAVDGDPATPEQGKAAFREKLHRGGRPRKANPKRAVSIRLSPEVLEQFKASGRGWQTRIDEALKDWLRNHRP